MPASISSLFLNINLTYLFTFFVNCGVVGHIKVVNLSKSEKSLNPGIMAAILANMALRVFLNVMHSTIKCCSVSKDLFAAVSSVLQYAQKRLFSGVIGLVLRKSSVASVCALMRRRVRDDLWFLLRTSVMYGSIVKDDLNTLYTLSLL